ncbi:MAG: TusE/DsrC/DsvC family sulfur relay protein [Anaerolineae bacterium]|nr:TusE/DsrC/DsvC family sulfur relay protein [Anaerolineae bacterium]MDQ7033604.1 TusE/DsrC/DsvC family sulfur relay protein [Anaerolineae bacterium]
MTSPNILENVTFDSDGFLEDYLDWTPDIAEGIAAEEGIVLTDRHYIVINYARKIFAETGDAPTMRGITKNTDVSTKELYALFPKGPAKKAARIAGLKKPTGCI